MTEAQLEDYFLETVQPLSALLHAQGLTFAEAEAEQIAFCQRFAAEAAAHHLRTDSFLQACLDLLQQPPEAVQALRWFCLALLTDCGLLFPDEVPAREQNVRCYLEQKERMEGFRKWWEDGALQRQRFFALLHGTAKTEAVTAAAADHAALHRIAAQQAVFRMERENPVLSENLMELLRQVNGSRFSAIKPFACCIILHTRQKLLLRSGYSPNLETVLQPKTYRIREDNGKNYAAFTDCVRLYMRLRACNQQDAAVDLALSDYCFAACTNLSEWYYFYSDMEELPVPISLRCRLRQMLPISFPRLPSDPHLPDSLEDWLLDTTAETQLQQILTDTPTLLYAYLQRLCAGEDTCPVQRQLCDLAGLSETSAAAVCLWETAANWLTDALLDLTERLYTGQESEQSIS